MLEGGVRRVSVFRIVEYTWFGICCWFGVLGHLQGPKRPHQQKDATSHAFWNPRCPGPQTPDCRILLFMWSFGPKLKESYKNAKKLSQLRFKRKNRILS